jgi:hypothetical protein
MFLHMDLETSSGALWALPEYLLTVDRRPRAWSGRLFYFIESFCG